MKILIVDDEFVSREKLQHIMKDFGECETAENGKDAMETIARAWENRSPFDLITLDVAMPGTDGTEILYKIRQMETERNIPKDNQAKVFMVTAHSDKDTVITSIQAGCDDYIAKPFNENVIIEKLKKCGLGDHITGPSVTISSQLSD